MTPAPIYRELIAETTALRARTGQEYATCAANGRLQLVAVGVAETGKHVVTPKSGWLNLADMVEYIRSIAA